MIIHGTEININDRVSFSVMHEFDISRKIGIFKGEGHYSVVRHLMDVNAYFRNLKHQEIESIHGKNNTPVSEKSFYIFQTDEGNFLCADEWIRPLSLKVISNKFIDMRVFNIKDEADEVKLLTYLRGTGYDVVKIK